MHRNALVASLPATLPGRVEFDWQVELPSEGLGGIAADQQHVIVGCRDLTNTQDVFVCLDAATGTERWRHAYLAPGRLDYGESSRATPLIVGDKVYVQGAFGDLHCLRINSGELVWARHIIREFDAKLPIWGVCGSPLLAGRRLVVQPGAPAASVVALATDTGLQVWQSPGRPTGYSSMISATLGGRSQIVGYDEHSLGGWDPNTGQRLWELVPETEGDFNVGTPLAVEGRLFVATENNGARLYRFDQEGRIISDPVGQYEYFAPDMHTPVAVKNLVFGIHEQMVCLDTRRNLKLCWEHEDNSFLRYASIIGSVDGRLLVLSERGDLLLIAANDQQYQLLKHVSLGTFETQLLSHPAIVDRHLFVRLGTSIARLSL
jgi:outer membrane protein assembly factor BamB